ncbi:similar to Saccharomyces cerevisiae YDL190C UFD2 Ubiquitin chain assembly factor (E4) that cooperates with a ubiquitin-activating enzyme (E1) [Maudiozyma barnettii]|uniref:RING-type E3 ubiquitin transferase n=1 Tax=Maudiozyma barnettii TaxID=61262 RepID=A0A8H2ZHI6_9SACH|nr:ubiquitin-ubiquitin ligase UFD2 [Kazachstania barnettii]CAB4253983.1 similar to Saccharomyces cerevisiae YDL190C UFD2 Ubiquitin chain assembly factor (E4) that cooperates with a ubiquitin-activating enzyme (E1) [Kazachstania barnettii]CAD1781733.1 similar to Saccharomyces cerevisiae YDL190C UFD2 Ubiquitin chain assembly factor (E4) that cooperates with a ubiquitin-activating enzyme (E1) [Kazachstania barnettii]
MSSKILEDIFQISTNPQNIPKGYYLVNFAEQGNAQTLDINNTDSALIYQLTENESLEQPFSYLNECFLRCQRQKRLNKNNSELDVVFKEIDRLVIGYGLVAFQIQEFALNGNITTYIAHILHRFDSYSDFLSQIIQRAIIEDSLADLLNSFFPNILQYIHRPNALFDLNDSVNYNNTLSVFELFVNFKQVASIFTTIDGFLPHHELLANEYEKKTILGPILTLSPLNINVALKNYGEVLERSTTHTNMIHESLQAEHKVVLDRLFFICDKIIRGSVESRTDMVSYWGQIVNKNHLRRADHAAQNKLASNAFMSNITLILTKFSQPFLDVSFNKIDKIDVNFFNTLNLFIDLSNETRLNSDFKEADKFYDDHRNDVKPNFISDCFFLTLTYLHYGIGGTLLYDEKITPQIKRIKEEIEKVKTFAASNSLLSSFVDAKLKQLEKTLSYTKALKDALKGFFSNKSLQLEVFDFICGASTFLLRVIDPNHDFPFKTIELPLIPDQVGVENVDNADYLRIHAPVPFKYYPEFVVEGPINYSLYISHYGNSPIFRNPRLQSFVELGTTILRCPELVSNPHLKGKLVQLFSVGSMPLTDNSPGFMMNIFEENSLVNKNLLYALLDFYVIVEKTGSSSQFYDKFNSRYSISIILEEMYNKIPSYKNQLIWQSQNNPDFFIRFIARMLNDLTFLLDEGLSNLSEVHTLGNQLNDPNSINQPEDATDESANDMQSRYQAAQRQAKSSCGLAAKSMTLFELYTKDISQCFVTAEVVDRLASMLNYNLESLVGPKCGNLRVKDPEQYSFNPKELLKALCSVYINLANEDNFIKAVARDSRSFNVDFFKRAIDILGRRTGLVSDEFCTKLFEFVDKAEKTRKEEEEEDMEYEDAPDEFLDPLMYTIMKDPVTLPTSKVNIDRSTIKAHLLSDSTDPFNRSPLRLEQVIPNEELKQLITEWKASKKSQK